MIVIFSCWIGPLSLYNDFFLMIFDKVNFVLYRYNYYYPLLVYIAWSVFVIFLVKPICFKIWSTSLVDRIWRVLFIYFLNLSRQQYVYFAWRVHSIYIQHNYWLGKTFKLNLIVFWLYVDPLFLPLLLLSFSLPFSSLRFPSLVSKEQSIVILFFFFYT